MPFDCPCRDVRGRAYRVLRWCRRATADTACADLECRGSASVGFVVGSVTNLGCVLRVEGVPEDRYIATIRKVGVDLGITQETALAWGVYAPVVRIGQGDLARRRPGQRLGRRRPQRRGRVGKSGTPAGKVTALAAR